MTLTISITTTTKRQCYKPTWAWIFTSAPASSNNLTTSNWPAKLAICKAVFPFFVAVFGFAPRSINSRTTSAWPSFEAKWSAFNPF